MALSWKEDFFAKLVEPLHGAGDPRLATAKLHPRKKTASCTHSQLHWLECLFDANRVSGNPDSQALIVQCSPKRGTEVDAVALRREFVSAGLSGDLQVNDGVIFAQYRWGFGPDTAFPVHDPRRVQEASGWTAAVLKVLFDHLERRQRILAPGPGASTDDRGTDYSLALIFTTSP